ncbi:MAG: energy-coupling factor transporter ATPase [Lachnospiraceae bacterium]|nr:energy-coupling factor transporter ATPase [Lachnospiraceae bacterium]
MSIEIKNLSYTYNNPGSENGSRFVLKNISATIKKDEITAIIGPTGSGKSTLVQHLNLLLHASEGDILYDGRSIYGDDFDRKTLRASVGLVFQYPEYQLFENDIFTDVCFGPKNLGLEKDEVESRAKKALLAVGFSDSDFSRSPFELSGGQRRRAAIAGVLAMQPEYLVLDEPAAGLDPKGRRELFQMLRRLHDENGVGIVLVSHSMDDVADFAGKILVLNDGRVIFDDTPERIFSHGEELRTVGLDVPQAARLAEILREYGFDLPQGLITMDRLRTAITDCFNRGDK